MSSVSRKAVIDGIKRRIADQKRWGQLTNREIAKELRAVVEDIESLPSSESEGEAAKLREENVRLKKFCEEWVWGEDKFQEFGGWERVEAMKSENERLRAALEQARRNLPNFPKTAVTTIDAALSTSETAVQPDITDKIRELWFCKFASFDYRGGIADTLSVLGITVPGIKDGRDTDHG